MSCTNVRFAFCLALVCLTAAVVPASAQHFKQITGTPLSQIAAGRKEVWGLYNSRVYRFNPNSETFAEIPGSLSQIAVGGGTLMQRDEVWGINNGEVYRFNFSTNAFVNVPGPSFSQIAVGAGYEDNCHPYEVWVITSVPSGFVYRYNYCTSQLENVNAAISNPGPVSGIGIGFTQIAVSAEGDVWGLYQYENSGPGVYEYSPSQRTESGEATWGGPGNTFTNPAYGTQINFQQITVGVNDVWAFDSAGLIWTWAPTAASEWGNREGTITAELVPIGALPAKIATGGDGVWVIYNNNGDAQAGGLMSRYDFQQKGFSNVPLPAGADAAAQIAVGSGAGVWMVDISDQVYVFVRP